MADKCANCGRADLLQPDVANYQCLACGALTNIATGQVVVGNIPMQNTSPSGNPNIQLGVVTPQAPGDPDGYRFHSTADDPAPSPDMTAVAAQAPVVAPAPVVQVAAPDVPDVFGTPSEAPTAPEEPTSLDLSGLSPEQVAAIESIAHPEV